jgi:hypothetical protein
LLALAFALPWLFLLARRRALSPWTWLLFVMGAAVFPFSIAWIQVPIQTQIGVLLSRVFPAATIQRYLLLAAIPTIFVSGLVQEVVKFGLALAGTHLLRGRGDGSAGLAAGGAVGAGYGGFEAFWVFDTIFGVGFSWATVQLAGWQALTGFVERFFTVPFHAGAAALSGYGYATRRPWRFLALAVLMHSLVNYGVVLVQKGILSAIQVEFWIAAGAVIVMAVALVLVGRARRGGPEPEPLP